MPTQRNFSNVNVGTSANSGDGDLVRDAFTKINDNFNSLYSGGQYVGFPTDGRLNPGYTWSNDKDTGMYRPGSGRIAFSLNGVDSLNLNEDGTITWFGSQLATQGYVNSQISNFTGGISAANITVVTGSGTANVTINGIPVVSSLPTTGNHPGRIVFFTGDIWIFSDYPSGNGAGLPANPSIARLAGSDSRWIRFRGEGALSVGSIKPATAPEGTIFYETSNTIPYLFISGSWKTLSSVITSSAPSGLEVLTSLPATGSPDNYTGRTVVVGSIAYIFISGQWSTLSSYVSGAAGAGGISSGAALPSIANVGELFRVTPGSATPAGLYIYDTAWRTIPQYTANTVIARIPTLPFLPTDVTYYSPGDLIIVGSATYILNTTKTSWDFFTPNSGSGTITGIALNSGQVGTTELAANAVTTVKIASNVIISSKLVSNTLTTREFADNSVTSAKIAANSITTSKIQDNSITGEKIAANTINGAKIVSGTIGKAQLAANIFTGVSVSANSLSEISLNLGTITSGVLRSSDNRFVIDLNNKSFRIEL